MRHAVFRFRVDVAPLPRRMTRPTHHSDLPGLTKTLISRKMDPAERGAHEKESI